jgi:hypothetical protein
LLRLDQKIASGMPMSLKRVANILNTDAMLFQEFCDRFSKYGDRTLRLFAGGEAVEVPVFFWGKWLLPTWLDHRRLRLANDYGGLLRDRPIGAAAQHSFLPAAASGTVDRETPTGGCDLGCDIAAPRFPG